MSAMQAPTHFPVVWKDPSDEKKFWMQDTMHAPFPITPAAQVIGGTYIARGFTEAFKEYSIPLKVGVEFQNGYYYMAMSPIDATPQQMAELEKQSQEKCEKAVANYTSLWENQWLPEIKKHIHFIHDFDIENAPLDKLVAHLERSLERIQRLWEIHFLNSVPEILVSSVFEEMYRDIFESHDTFEALKLLQGLENHSTRTGLEIWKLSRLVAQDAGIAKIFDSYDASSVWDELKSKHESSDFVTKFQAFLDEYGKRNEHFVELDSPAWIEDPTPVINSIHSFLKNPERNLETVQREKIREREDCIAEARKKLNAFPEAVRNQFETLLGAAQTANQAQEDHNYLLDQLLTYGCRRLLLAFGRHFTAQGLLDKANDAFYLTPDEIIATAKSAIDQKAVITKRKGDYEKYRKLNAPPVLGTQPTEPPPDTPFNRAIGKFLGTPPQKSEHPNELIGNSASPGKVTGRAVVMHSLQDAERLQKGDILVTKTTNPSWTPLFSIAAAVVTDTGGVLCHCAIVAREYNIPAVIGLGIATMAIQDGSTIEVDGNAGTVKIVKVN